MNNRKNILFIFVLLLLFAPLIQQQTGLLRIRPLTGSGDPAAYPSFDFRSWFSGSFQSAFDKSTEENLGFRSAMIRGKNQLQYSLFSQANAAGVVVGKKRYLYEFDYLRAYTGKDYLGEWFWKEKFRRLHVVADTLHRLGVTVAIVLEPGKASYFPEYIPDPYLKHAADTTNYEVLVTMAKKHHLPILDLNAHFVEMKDRLDYPLYTRGGIHWAYSAMLLATDTILQFVDELVPEQIPSMNITRGEVTRDPRDTDDDLVDIMNLVVKPKPEDLHYPRFSFEQMDALYKPKVLAVSDSYYFNILNADIPEKAFANEAFWYYSKAIYPDSWTAPKDTSMIDIRQEVEQMDVLLLMATERFYYKFVWNFIEGLYKTYYPAEIKHYLYDYSARIITDYQWFNLVVKDAEHRRIPLSQALKEHAAYQIWKDDSDGQLVHNTSYYVMKIRKDAVWTEKIREKAQDNGRSFEEQLVLDAQWMAEND